MVTYAHIVNGVVAEPLFTPPDGFSITDCFAPGLLWVDVSSISPAPDVGWTATQSGADWTFAASVVVPPAPAVPQSVSAFQARAVLHSTPSKTNSGKTMLDDVNAALTSPPADPIAALAWEYATVFERGGRFINEIAPALGLTSADLDALFTAAATIQG